jgi:L-rhamnose mutarotase
VGQLVGLKPEALEEYKRIHVKIWPEIEAALVKAGITNYSIYHFQGQLFAYYEYTGPEHEYQARMQELAAAPRMREWWDVTEPMQVPLDGRPPGAWWAVMDEVFHQD